MIKGMNRGIIQCMREYNVIMYHIVRGDDKEFFMEVPRKIKLVTFHDIAMCHCVQNVFRQKNALIIRNIKLKVSP